MVSSKNVKNKKMLIISLLLLNSFILPINKVNANILNNNIELESTMLNTEEDFDKSKKEVENVIELYCSVYGIKSYIVYGIINELTCNYSSYNFINRYNIYPDDNTCYNSYDYQILNLVRDLYINPENYGYEFNDIISNKQVSIDMTIREYNNKISTVLGIDPVKTLSIACAESHYFEAKIANENNNPYALNCGGSCTFDNIYIGITEGIFNLKDNYFDCGLTTYSQIGSKYCPGSNSWVNLVTGVEYELEQNDILLYDEKTSQLSYK